LAPFQASTTLRPSSISRTGSIGIRPLHGRHGNGAREVTSAVAAASD
jgi:hypothetical protein